MEVPERTTISVVREPLGTTPKQKWIGERIQEIARAIHERSDYAILYYGGAGYGELGKYDLIQRWNEELRELLAMLKGPPVE